MTVQRMSISVPPELEAQIRAAAREAGLSVSTWLAQAAEHAAKIQAGRRLIREYEAEHGPLPQEERQEARRFLREVGILPAEDMRAAG
ncbi:MAG TPA: hypothetical protein VKF59_07190 [Candidatus Dormibacteraeota bacterium]|nr:hypothetical protein [Candidatus Dormibacteraeota bacterium]